MTSKYLALLIAFILLVGSSACSHSPKKTTAPLTREELSSPKESARAMYTPEDDDKWWKKDENQWLLAALIVLGVGIAVGAAIYVAFGAGGFTIAISK